MLKGEVEGEGNIIWWHNMTVALSVWYCKPTGQVDELTVLFLSTDHKDRPEIRRHPDSVERPTCHTTAATLLRFLTINYQPLCPHSRDTCNYFWSLRLHKQWFQWNNPNWWTFLEHQWTKNISRWMKIALSLGVIVMAHFCWKIYFSVKRVYFVKMSINLPF